MHLPILRRADRRRILAALAAACLAATAAAQGSAGGFDLTRLMALLARVPAGEATFTETRTVPLLDRTLQSSGLLRFRAPDTFVRETLKPRAEKIAVAGNEVTLSQGSRSRTVPLDSVPEAAVIMEAIRGTLTGNRDAIDRHFESSVSGSPQRWTLELRPREPRLALLVTSVRVTGENTLLREVDVAMSGGDRSVMTIAPVAPSAASAGGGE